MPTCATGAMSVMTASKVDSGLSTQASYIEEHYVVHLVQNSLPEVLPWDGREESQNQQHQEG